MANSAQARKRARQAITRRDRNKSQASRMRTTIKQVISAIEAKDKELASTKYREMTSALDTAAKNGQIHRNKAARHKSRLNAEIKAL